MVRAAYPARRPRRFRRGRRRGAPLDTDVDLLPLFFVLVVEGLPQRLVVGAAGHGAARRKLWVWVLGV